MDTNTTPAGFFLLTVGEYEEWTVLAVTHAPSQVAADQIAAGMTVERAKGYTIDSGPLTGTHTHHTRDTIVVTAVRVALAEPPRPDSRDYHDPHPDRYLPGSQYPDTGGLAGFYGLDQNTRRIAAAVVLELSRDLAGMTDPDAIRSVVATRGATIGRTHP